jgi:hypothetical protein
MPFLLNCSRCQSPIKLNDYAIDKSCQNKLCFSLNVLSAVILVQLQWQIFLNSNGRNLFRQIN